MYNAVGKYLLTNKLSIPVVALVDTNCNPDVIDYVIPGNDDALKSIKTVFSFIIDVIGEMLLERKRKASLEDDKAAGNAMENKSEEPAPKGEKTEDKSLDKDRQKGRAKRPKSQEPKAKHSEKGDSGL